MAPRLDGTRAKPVGDALVAVIEKSKDQDLCFIPQEARCAMVPRLDPTQAKRISDALIVTLEKPEHQRCYCPTVFRGLAPRLEASQAERAWNILFAINEKGPQEDKDDVYEAFVALGSRLEPALRERLSTKATIALLDYISFFGPNNQGWYEAPRAIVIARSISSPRSLASLLSHPACVGKVRDDLLHRFEELVFYDGAPVFGKPKVPSAIWELEVPDSNQPSPDQLPRQRLHNLHDAAAWIQQNWPDFDLETNCPATRRGSR